MKNLSFCILISFLIFNQGISQTNEEYSIGKTFNINSQVLSGEVTYYVHLPYGYEESEEQYPVVYILNSHLTSTFASAVATTAKLSHNRIPDMIIVGISNTGVAGNYWACPDDSGKVGNAEKFYSFLEKELVPEIQKSFRTNHYRILMGQSNTGLYATYNMLKYPDLFNAYVVSSPMFGWCEEFYNDELKSFLNSEKADKKKLYISYGDMDYTRVLEHIDKIEEILRQHAPSNFQWEIEGYKNTGHVPLVTLNNGLLFFFSECTLTPENRSLSIQEIKAHFEKLSEEFGFKIIPKNGVITDLAMRLSGEQKIDKAIEMIDYNIELYPKSVQNHYIKGIIYYRNDNTDSAIQCFEKCLEIDPDFTRARRSIDRLNKSSE